MSKPNEDLIKIKVNYETRTVAKADYIKAKHKQLVEFGYSKLTVEEVEKSLNAVLSDSKETNVITMMISDDIVR